MAGQSTKSTLWRVVVAIAAALGASNAWGLGDEPRPGETVTQYLTPEILQALFPGADKVGEVSGTPPAASVSKGGHQLGYLFSTWDVTQSKGFSNRALILLVGVDLTGHITAARLVHHTEPIGILGIKDELFHRFVDNYKGHDLNEGVDIVSELSSSVLGPGSFSQRSAPGSSAAVKVDAVSRATTSSVLMSDAIVRGGRIVARSRGILGAPKTSTALDIDRFAPADWTQLEAAGAIGHLRVGYSELRDKLSARAAAKIGDPGAAPSDTFIDLYAALVTPAGIGINVLGETWYAQYTAGRGANEQMILIAANSAYSFLGPDWEHADLIGPIELLQGDRVMRLSPKQIKTLPFLHAKNAPDLTERALVFFNSKADFDPVEPWQLRLLVGSDAVSPPSFASFDLTYRIPESYVVKAAAAPPSNRASPGTVSAGPGGEIGNTRKGFSLAGDLVGSSGAHCYPRCRPRGIDCDPVLAGRDQPASQAASRRSCGLSSVDPCLARLVRGCAAHNRQPDHLHPYPRHRLSLGLSPGRPARCDLVRLYIGRAVPLGSGRVLWLALPVRRPSGVGQQRGTLAADSAARNPDRAARPPDRSEVPAVPWACRRIVPFMGPGHDGN